MFRRILEMRHKLEGIIQLQTIKYQRQLAIMLRDSKQRQNLAQQHQHPHQHQQDFGNESGGEGASPMQGVRKFGAGGGGGKYPSPIKTTHFTPSLTSIRSPAQRNMQHFASESVSDRMDVASESGGGDSIMVGLHNISEEEDLLNKKPVPGLGANIYAGNLKMISKVEQEEQRRVQAQMEARQEQQHS